MSLNLIYFEYFSSKDSKDIIKLLFQELSFMCKNFNTNICPKSLELVSKFEPLDNLG